MLSFSNLALVRALAGDPKGAIADALKGIETSRTGDYLLVEASTYENIAVAEFLLGDLKAAIEHGEHGLVLRSQSQSESWVGTALADLALCYAGLGDMETARARIDRMLSAEQYTLGTEWPQACHWAAARILHACGEGKRAAELLGRAKASLDEMLAQLEPARHERYLNVYWNREIVDASERGVWPPLAAVSVKKRAPDAPGRAGK
jgi:tetratricopeptide (TPR) repeat protein